MDFTNAHHNHNDGFWAYVATWQVPEVPREPEPAVLIPPPKSHYALLKIFVGGRPTHPVPSILIMV